MNKLFFITILLAFSIKSEAQNLVLNGDFEQYYSCPTYLDQIDSASFWFMPTQGTTDYFNQCALTMVGVPSNYAGYQFPKSGFGYAGGYTFFDGTPNYREYLEGSLAYPLIAGICYHFELYMNLGNISQFKASDIGVYFSDTLISNVAGDTLLPFTPQINNIAVNMPDTLDWKLVSGSFTATGGESFFIIGNFHDDSITDTLFYNPQAAQWATYILYDDVSLTPCTGIDENNSMELINIFPNPFSNEIKITSTINEIFEITLYDVTSKKLFDQSFVGSSSINTEQLSRGIYLYKVRNRNGLIKVGKIVKEN